MWKVRELADKVTNVVMNYTEVEAKVREATNDDAWGPTGVLMQEIAQATFTFENLPEVMTMLWKRMLQDNRKNWRRTYKSLLLLNYLVRNGSERVVTSSREHIYDLRALENYTYVDEYGKDQGINIRHKVKELIEFIQDDEKLREERKKAKKNKDKYVGMSSDAIGVRGFGSSRDQWDSRWRGKDENEWDQDFTGRRDPYTESPNNSDDGERYDSDPDSSFPPPQTLKKSVTTKEYKDTAENTDSPPNVIESKTSTPTRKPKTATPSKKIDLGAAANYGKTQAVGGVVVDGVNTDSNNMDLLGDVLSDNSSSSGVTMPQSQTEFGDFNAVFGTNNTVASVDTKDDEFADFTSAFNSSAPVPSVNSPLSLFPSQQQQTSIQCGNNNVINNTMSAANGRIITGSGVDLLSAVNSTAVNNSVITNNNGNSAQQLLFDDNNIISSSNMTDTISSNQVVRDGLHLQKKTDDASLSISSEWQKSSISDSHYSMEMIVTRIFNILASKVNDVEESHLYYNKLESTILQLTEYFPGPVTPQQLIGIDEQNFDYLLNLNRFGDLHYNELLKCVMNKVDDINWFGRSLLNIPNCLIQLVSVDGATLIMFHELLFTMSEIIKSVPNKSSKLDISVKLLELLITSDAIQSAYLNLNFGCWDKTYDSFSLHEKTITKNEIEIEMCKEMWNECVQTFITLPDRIANKLSGKVPDVFLRDNFCSLCCYHISKIVFYLAETIMYNKNKKLYINSISKFFGKCLLHFNGSKSLIDLIQILYSWCFSKHCGYRNVIQKLFLFLDSTSIEVAILYVLKHCTDSGLAAVSLILSDDVIDSDSWFYVLVNKIPLMTYTHDLICLKNLVYFLGEIQLKRGSKYIPSSFSSVAVNNNDGVLNNLIIHLLTIWSDRSALLHSPVEQHLYISKIIVLSIALVKKNCINYTTSHTDFSFIKLLVNDIKTKLFFGLPIHLESTSDIVRTIGMITAECIVKIINDLKVIDCGNEKEKCIQLEFDYHDMKEDLLKIVNEIKAVGEYDFSCYENLKKEKDGDLKCKGDKLLNDFLLRINLLNRMANCDSNNCESFKDNKLGIRSCKTSNNTGKVGSTTNYIPKDDDDDLDSDDDLEPYDLSNDIKLLQTKQPKYLRDLIKNLFTTNDQRDPDIWIASLEVCEELIYKQLPNDDVSLGLELMDILLCLEMKFYCSNFDDLKFSSALAIVIVYPADTAEFICTKFHDDNKYSIAQRLFMLDLLSGGAKILSNPSKDPVKEFSSTESFPKHNEPVKDLAKKLNWEEIVKQRINNKTRRFLHRPKISPVLGKENKFARVAGSFLFPLLRGKGKTTPGIMFRVDASTKESPEDSLLLLVHILRTCAIVMSCSVNCYSSVRMAKELLEATWSLRFHSEVKIREGVISSIAAVIIAVPKSLLKSDLFNDVIEAKLWLEEIVESHGIFGKRTCEVDANCRGFASQVVLLINSIIIADD
ncbi:clathrin interactor lqfR [Lycorma delicatula]|uniref:clathrin interactor lqfR n=1 Tax=Lycorma delicatula TaxID=130591 RepID=UPI003F517D44